jgi:hypothetical protein
LSLYNFAYSGRSAPEQVRGSEQTAVLQFNPRRCKEIPMEAEKINAIARRLADVESRASELRRYL